MKAPWWGKASQFHAGQWSDRVLRTSSGSLGQRAMKPASDRSCALVMTSGASSGTARTCTPRLRTAKRGPTAWYDWPSDDSLHHRSLVCVCECVLSYAFCRCKFYAGSELAPKKYDLRGSSLNCLNFWAPRRRGDHLLRHEPLLRRQL